MLVDQIFPVLARQLRQHGATDGARHVASHGRLQIVDRDLALADRRDFRQRHVGPLLSQRMPLRIADQHLRSGPTCIGLLVVARRLHPGVFAVLLEVGVLGNRLALPGMLRFLALVPGMRQVFGDGLAKLAIGRGVERMRARDVAVEDDAARQIERRRLARRAADRERPGSCSRPCHSSSTRDKARRWCRRR